MVSIEDKVRDKIKSGERGTICFPDDFMYCGANEAIR